MELQIPQTHELDIQVPETVDPQVIGGISVRSTIFIEGWYEDRMPTLVEMAKLRPHKKF